MEADQLEKKPWWDYLEEDLQELLKTSLVLKRQIPSWKEKYHDYSFVVFPASKAYEGFLKKLFFDMGFISKEDYFGKRFRIGKALNPELDRRRYKNQSVYDKLTNYCGGEDLANTLWSTWKNCRNVLFHWFPKGVRAITFEEAKQKIYIVFSSIDAAFEGCNIGEKNNR